MRQLDFSIYQDKVLAAWLGKSIGGTIGAYLENHKELKHLNADELWPEKIPPNDDLDIQLVWLEAMQEKGCWLDHDDLVAYWQDRCWYNFAEYGFFLHNVQRGIMPPLSGYWNNDFFRESEGCPIRSDIWGLVSPGNPELAARMAELDGGLDHAGFSVGAEMFYAAMSAQAPVAGSREEIVRAGLSVLPENSAVRNVVSVVERIAGEFADFSSAWRVAIRRFGDRDASKAITNLAIVMLAWYKSGDDFEQAMVHCANSGWDTDCTAATLGAILGAWKGTACIPESWRKQLGTTLVCGIEVRHKTASLMDLAYETACLGVEMSHTRNHAVRIADAPAVPVRTPPPKGLELRAEYPGEPVLYADRTTKVRIIAVNPTEQEICGSLSVTGPKDILISPDCQTWRLPPGERREVVLGIRRKEPGAPLPDKNRFKAGFLQNDGRRTERVFGLNGARQWLVYGPYWTMYDREKYVETCPYAGPGRNRHPGWAGCGGDSYQHFQYLDLPYLDEEALALHDLPEEVPMHLQSGIDLLTAREFGGWHGSCCRYLSRTFTIPEGRKICLNLGRTGFIKVWLDGRAAFRGGALHSWSLGEADYLRFVGTGNPQRLVVKLVNPTDEAALAFYFLDDGEHDPKRGISYLTDEIIDEVPTGCDL